MSIKSKRLKFSKNSERFSEYCWTGLEPDKEHVEVFAMMYWCVWFRTLELYFKMKYRKNHTYHLAIEANQPLKVTITTKFKKQHRTKNEVFC